MRKHVYATAAFAFALGAGSACAGSPKFVTTALPTPCTVCTERAPLRSQLGCYWLGNIHDADTPAYCVEEHFISVSTGGDRIRVRWIEKRPGELHADPSPGGLRSSFVLYDEGLRVVFTSTELGRRELDRVVPDSFARELIHDIPPTKPLCDAATRCRVIVAERLGAGSLKTPEREGVQLCRRALDEAADRFSERNLPLPPECERPKNEGVAPSPW